jgi:hypothetical protein
MTDAEKAYRYMIANPWIPTEPPKFWYLTLGHRVWKDKNHHACYLAFLTTLNLLYPATNGKGPSLLTYLLS